MKKYRFFYMTYLFLACILAVVLQNRFSIAIVITLLVLPVLSGFTAFLSSKKIEISQKLGQSHAIKGITTDYYLTVENTGRWFCPHMHLHFQNHDALVWPDSHNDVIAVLPFSETTYKRTIQCVYRGAYSVGCQSVELYDFFRLFRIKKKVEHCPVLLVYPHLNYIQNLPIDQNNIQEEAMLFNFAEDDYTTVSDFRQYSEEDSMKKIHWKLSSKKDELIVKKYSSFLTTNLAIALNLEKVEAELPAALEDQMVEAAISMMYRCVQLGKSMEFLTNTNQFFIQRIENVNDFNQIYASSATMHFNSTLPFHGLISHYLGSRSGSLNLFILTSRLDYPLYEQVRKSVTAGYHTTIVHFGKTDPADTEQTSLRKLFREMHTEPVPAQEFFTFL